MAIVEFALSDIEKLAGRRLTKSILEERIPMMGAPLEKAERGRVWFEIFPNRPDMLSAEGFARAVRLFLGGRQRAYKVKSGSIRVNVMPSVKQVRPCIAAAVVRNVRLTPAAVESLMQAQEKLHDTLGRKRRKVAIGVHDLAKVKPPFTYKAVAPESVRFVPLGKSDEMNLAEICKRHEKGQAYGHILAGSKLWPVITDANGDVLSFPPIINGSLTRVTDGTKALFIDVTGTSQAAVDQALNILATSMTDRGFSVESVSVGGRRTPDLTPTCMKVDAAYVNALLGLSITETKMAQLLSRMGIGYSKGAASVPAYRTDIMHPMDIAEDVAIAYGYQTFKPEQPKGRTIARRLREEERAKAVRMSLVGLGFQEVKSMTLTNESQFSKMNITGSACTIANSVTAECTQCRAWLLPSLLRTLSQNMHVEYPQRIFELGDCVVPDARTETGAALARKAAAAISGTTAGYEEISAALSAFLKSMGVALTLEPAEHGSFITGRCAKAIVRRKTAGFVGEVRPEVLKAWGLEKPVAAFEVDVMH